MVCKYSYKTKKILVITLLLSLIVPISTQHIAYASTQELTSNAGVSDTFVSYENYLGKYQNTPSPQFDELLSFEQGFLSGNAVNNDKGALINGESQIEWNVTVPENGLYNLALDYAYEDNLIHTATISLLIDDMKPFNACEQIEISKWWMPVDMQIKQDQQGNDIRPQVQVLKDTFEETFLDEDGMYGYYSFYLHKGINNVKIKTNSSSFLISGLRVYNKSSVKYQDYIKDSSFQKQENTAKPIMIQAENYSAKSSAAISLSSDRSGPDTLPNDPNKLKLNTISGSSWSEIGEELYWTFTVETSGYYNIGLRYRQSTVEGFFVSREIKIDNKILFDNFNDYKFNYSQDWKYEELNSGNQKLSVFLTAGTHTISMKDVAGDTGAVVKSLSKSIYALNEIYRKIITITGVRPDPYRDYYLHKEMPGLLDELDLISKELDSVATVMNTLSGENGGQSSIIKQLSYQLKTFIEKPNKIPVRLESFKSNVSAVAALMLMLQKQPLDLDYIIIKDYKDNSVEKSSVFSFLSYKIKAFVGSFFNDYNYIGSDGNGQNNKHIVAWFSGGREQAEIIKRMIDESFTPESNINVKMELVQIPIAQAILAGTAPDIVLNVARGQPVNLAARGALYQLNKFSDYESVLKNYTSNATIPYTYNGGVYGLPVTLDFQMMFYRTDILKELGVSPPKTWDEFYEVLKIVQRNNMEIGLPYTVMSSQGTIDGGMGAKDIFPTFVLQRGVDIYSKDLKTTNFENKEVIDAFEKWTDLYTLYKLPLTYDFYNRFRTGVMPIGIQPYGMYNLLSAAAPEIKGMWDMELIPGTMNVNGNINRTEAASGTATVIPSVTKNANEAWQLMKWWLQDKTQTQYGLELEMLMGKASRYNPANLKSISDLPWDINELSKLTKQISYIQEIPEVVGGYYTTRGLDNAFRSVVLLGKNYRDCLLEENVSINKELERKQNEVNLQK